MSWAARIVGLVVAERIAELFLSRRNTRRLQRMGGQEAGRGHYPLIVLLHVAWLIAVYAAAPRGQAPIWWLTAIYLALQGIRYWAIATLGHYWTTRIVNVPEAPLVKDGPYRFMRHPNYAVVVAEIAILPLAFREPRVAAIFSLLNVLLLAWRIRVEARALDSRRQPDISSSL